VKELSPVASNYRSEMTLDQYLKQHNILGIQGIDTRKLVKHLRTVGAKKAVISTLELDPKKLVKKAKRSPSIVGVDLVKEVTSREAYDFTEVMPEEFAWGDSRKKKYNIVAVDSGIKRNILRKLNQHGFSVKVVPVHTKADEILGYNPQGVFLSNGPGDPAAVKYLVETVRKLIGKVPMFGICLGHQLIGQALGGKTSKLKFGHHGNNQPVMDLKTGKIEITSQNHNFVVNVDSLSKDEVEITHINLNDKSLEGFRHKKHPVFCVQYHPENAPGPHDSDYLFSSFYELVCKHAG
jgi:carbamoyl-phosphate synthase small subunit